MCVRTCTGVPMCTGRGWRRVIPGSERPDMGAGSELDPSGRAGGTPNR